METGKEIFQRTELLLGTETMERIAQCRVILFGVGGVGSWCAESLIRSGIGQRLGVSSMQTAQWNNIKNPDLFSIDQRLTI